MDWLNTPINIPGLPPGITAAQIMAEPLFWTVIYALAAIIVLLAVWAVFKAFSRRAYQTGLAFRRVVLLVTVPKESQEKGESGQQEKTLQEVQESIGVMEAVFTAIGGLNPEKGMKAGVLGREDSVSFEIIADHGLVTFYVATSPRLQDYVVQQIHAQYPHAQIEEATDYNCFVPHGTVVGASLKFRQAHYFPIKTFRKLESDPLNSLTNALAKVSKDEGAGIQIVVRSADSSWRRPALSIASAMQQGKSYKQVMAERSTLGQLGKMFAPAKKKEGEPSKEYRLSPMEDEMLKSFQEKAGKMGLDVNIRVVASAKTKDQAKLYLDNIVGAFGQYGLPQFGNILLKSKEGSESVVRNFIFRHFIENAGMVMNGEELASLYHMPLPSTETPNIRWLMSRKSAPPQNMPKDGLRLGDVTYRGVKTPVFIKPGDRMRHMYCIGKSGSGKSEYIATLAKQDILNGDGLCIVDPHGDLVDLVLGCVPKERADDVVIFDPSDLERPIGMNMLESPNEEMKDYVCGEMIAIFYKLFPPEMIGPMFEHTMRNMMLTLMSDPENPGTIAEIPRLVVDPEYQKQWVAKVKDPVVLNYWQKEVAKTSDFHKSEMFGYITSKVGRFVENGMLRNIIGQQKSALNFRQIMDEKKILLVSLSKGKIGDINAGLLGLIVVTKLQMAAMGRADMPAEKRNPFYLYIDEFQNFITPSIATILSEARKYALSLYLSHQYLGQLSPKGDNEIRDAVLGNAGTMMIGRIGIEDAQVLEKEFQPTFSAFDLVNPDKFTWNCKMLIDNASSRPFNYKSNTPVQPDRRIAEAIRMLSRLKYGRDRSIVEQEILDRTQLGATPTPASPAAK